jgi:hypothetical protein
MPKNTSADRARFDYLVTMWRAAPLGDADLAELKALARKFNRRMAEYIEKNPEMC